VHWRTGGGVLEGVGDIAPEDEDPQGGDGPMSAGELVRGNNGGILPNALEAANAFALSDFLLNPMRTLHFVPKRLNEKYSTVFGRVVEELPTAAESAEPGRTKRIGTALRWYVGIPQLFLRKPRRSGGAHVVKAIELRLTSCSEASTLNSSAGG